VILASVGTHGQEFPRFFELLRALDDEIVVQYGHNPPPEGFSHAVPFMAFDEMLAWMYKADVVVTHAGVGSILCARETGHLPIVVPRLAKLGEHVDDHQVEITRTLEKRGHVIAIEEADGLQDAVSQAIARRNGGITLGERPLHDAVRAALHAHELR